MNIVLDKTCLTIGELREALKEFSDDTPLRSHAFVSIWQNEEIGQLDIIVD